MDRRMTWAIAMVLAAIVAVIAFMWLAQPAPAADGPGNPMGTRAGGRFEYVQYDDAMEVLTDTETGKQYLVWYWRDDVEVVPL